MRLAPFTRRVVVGLPVVAACFAVPPVAFAWELFGSPGAQSRPAASKQSANTQSPTGRGPLFQGQEINWPTLPFMRSKPKPKQPANAPNHGVVRPVPNAAVQTASRFAGPASAPQQRAAPPMRSERSAAPLRPYHASTTAPAVPQRMAVNPVPNAAAGMRSTARQPSLAQSESPRTPEIAAPSAAESPADLLIAQAHESSASARTEEDYTRIIDACKQARNAKPSAITYRYAAELASWAFNRRGQLKAEAGRQEEALVDFNDAVRADASRWLACHNRGVLLAQSGQYEQAFDDFSRTIELDPKFAKAYSNRAALHLLAGDADPALHDYRRAIELDPKLAVAQRGCGRAYHLHRQLDEALRHYNEAVRLAPHDAYAVASRADVLTDLGRYAEAAAEYERSLQLEPDSDHACNSSAWLLATCPDEAVRNPQLAIERAQRAIELTGGQDATCFDTLAAAEASAGNFSAATGAMRQAVQMAAAETRDVYQQRLLMYQQQKPYRIAPLGEVAQASYLE